MTSEFELIRLIAERAGDMGEDTLVGIGDDAAVLLPKPGHELIVTMDTLNSGVHFAPDVSPGDLGHKSLAVNLSDLAAMGADPQWALLSLSMPGGDAGWLQQFIDGFLVLAREHGVRLIGGDTCSGPMSVTVTALGWAVQGQRLLRSTARPGDLVVVSGHLGDAAYALHLMEQGQPVPATALQALQRPLPRVGLGQRLVGKATACVDISDGLVADLGHIAVSSGCGAVIELASLPASGELCQLGQDLRWPLQLSAGDDYELCFTWPPGEQEALSHIAESSGIPLSVVGRMVEKPGIVCRKPDGHLYEPMKTGHQHFDDRRSQHNPEP